MVLFIEPKEIAHEKMSKKTKTTLTGYVPLKMRIESMIAAGKRLYDARDAVYDSDIYKTENPDDLPLDPTRSPGFDSVDADAIVNDLNDKISAKKDAKKVKTQDKAKTAAPSSGAATAPEKAAEQPPSYIDKP